MACGVNRVAGGGAPKRSAMLLDQAGPSIACRRGACILLDKHSLMSTQPCRLMRAASEWGRGMGAVNGGVACEIHAAGSRGGIQGSTARSPPVRTPALGPAGAPLMAVGRVGEAGGCPSRDGCQPVLGQHAAQHARPHHQQVLVGCCGRSTTRGRGRCHDNHAAALLLRALLVGRRWRCAYERRDGQRRAEAGQVALPAADCGAGSSR